MDDNIGMLYRSFQRALLFNIPEGVRLISFEQKSDSEIEVLVCSAFELGDEAVENIFEAAGEVEGDFPIDVNCDVRFFVGTGKIDNLPKLKHLVFAMAK